MLLRAAAGILAAVIMRVIVASATIIAVIVLLTIWIAAPVPSEVMEAIGARRGRSG